MQNFMKTILSAMKTWTKGKIKESTADWNENDSSKDSYVKNRTHWEEEVPVSVMLEQMVGYYPFAGLINDDGFVFEEGATYIVTCNGTRYELTGRCYSEWDMMYVGNGLYMDGVDDNSGVPFAIAGYSDGNMFLSAPFGVYTVSVSTLVDGVETEVIGEQTRYICWEWGLSEIALETGSTYSVNFDGDIYEFTAVENSDSSAIIIGDMTQYPFEIWHSDGWLILYSMTAGIHNISLTNTTNGSQMIDRMYVGRYSWYENMNIANLQEGKTYTVVWNDEVYSCVAKNNRFDGIYIGNPIYAYLDEWDISAKDTGEPFFIATYEPNNWNVIMFDYEKTNTVSISTTQAVIHKLDSKYLDLPTNLATTDDIEGVDDLVNEAYQVANNAIGQLETKMDATNPVGTGSFSMNRKSGTTIGNYSVAEGYNTTASGNYSYAEGYNTQATTSTSAGVHTTTSTAAGYVAHAEGYGTVACGAVSHAEGNGTMASGQNSHAEGRNTTASGRYSHAEGYSTTASGHISHAEGFGTTAQRLGQHVQGQYNILDTDGTTTSKGKYAHIVGNGTSELALSNAHTLDWNGVGWFQGGLQVGGNAQDDGAKNVLLEGVPQDYIILNDVNTGAPYKLEIRDGNLVSSLMASFDDFTYTTNDDGTKTITGWKETYLGAASTEMIVPNDGTIII